MNTSLIVPDFTTAISIGLGCGTCCSPIISTFLSTYVVSHSNGMKKGILSFISFFFVKMASVSLMCIASALISCQFISESGYIGSFNLRLFSQAIMSLIGAFMVICWFLELKNQKKCVGCKGCEKQEGKSGFIPMLIAGLIYSITPYAPLLLMIGYCFTLPVSVAGMTGIVFGISSMVSPALLSVVVTGALSKKWVKKYQMQWNGFGWLLIFC